MASRARSSSSVILPLHFTASVHAHSGADKRGARCHQGATNGRNQMGTDRAGKTAVITGGGRGFGKGFGEALAAEGAHVVLVDIDGAAAEEAAAEIRGNSRLATGLQGDVTDDKRMAEVMAQAAALQGGIDILINNAGLHSEEYGQPITKMGLAKTKRLFEVNVIGTICCTLAAWPHMKGRARASIVNSS